MEVDSLNCPVDLVEADVVKALETSPVDGSNTVVRDQKLLLPSHEDVIFLCHIPNVNAAPFGDLGVRFECEKLAPMRDIDPVICSPLWVLSEEAIMWANDFTFKICRQCRVGIS